MNYVLLVILIIFPVMGVAQQGNGNGNSSGGGLGGGGGKIYRMLASVEESSDMQTELKKDCVSSMGLKTDSNSIRFEEEVLVELQKIKKEELLSNTNKLLSCMAYSDEYGSHSISSFVKRITIKDRVPTSTSQEKASSISK